MKGKTKMADTTYNFIPEKWSTKLDFNLYNDSTMLKLVNTDYEGEAKNTDTVFIRTPGTVAQNTYAGSITYENLSPTKTSLLIDQKKYFAFKCDDITEAQADVKVLESHIEEVRETRRLTIDTHLLSQYANASSSNQVDASTNDGGSANAGITLNKDTIVKQFHSLRKKMAVSKAFFGSSGERWVVVPPAVTEYLVQAPEFLTLEKLGEKAVKEGMVGQIAGFNVYELNNLAAVSSIYYCLAGSKKSITFAHQIKKIETIRLQDSFDTAIRGLDVYGSKVINSARLGTVLFAA